MTEQLKIPEYQIKTVSENGSIEKMKSGIASKYLLNRTTLPTEPRPT